ncbi:MAG: DUF2341 domain-containing protein [Acidimicrobiales bacterium]
MSVRRLVRALGRGITMGLAGVTCVLALAAVLGGAFGWRPVVVLTGSMGDTVPVGSLALAAPTDRVEIGDVLVMRGAGRPTVTHRIVGLNVDDTGHLVATTRGDANPDIDPVVHPVDGEQLTVRRVVPGLGRVLVELRTPLVGGLLVAVLAIGFLIGALRRIWGGARPAPVPPVPPARARFRRPVGRERWTTAAAACAGAALVGVTATLALYTASATADANQFTARDCYDAQLRGVQRGTATSTSNGVSTIAIAAVDPARSFVLFSASSASGQPDESSVSVRLASSTSLQLVRASDGAPPGTVQVEWSVVEYACGVSVQRGVVPVSGAASVDVAVTAVDPSSSFVVAGVLAPSGSTALDGSLLVSAGLLDTDTVRVEASTVIAGGSEVAWQLVSFDDPGDASVQRVTASLAAGDGTATVTLPTPVDLASTLVLASPRSNGTGAAIGERFVRVRLLDAQTVEVRRELTTGTVAVDVQVVELHDGSTVQQGVLDLAIGEAVASATVPAVTPTRSTVISTVTTIAGWSGGSTSMSTDDVAGEGSARVRLVGTSQVEVQRDATASTASFAWQLVTWGGPAWADLQSPFRRRIDVVGGTSGAPAGYTTSLVFDHAAMVGAGQSLASGDDVRVWRHDGTTWTELDRVLDDGSSWDAIDTTVWFRTTEPIGPGQTVSYWMYFGDTTPQPVLADPANVWLAVEGFEGGGLGIFEDRTGGTGWYRAQPWTRRWTLTIPAGTVVNDLVDQPVLVHLTSTDLAATAQADGSDLRFVAADGVTRLPYELESWNPATGALSAWVRVPQITAAAPTTVQLYAGAADAPAGADPRAVWSDVTAVWQLAGSPAGPSPVLDDSGPGRLDGIALADAAGGTDPTGPSIELDGTLDRLESAPFVPPSSSLSVSSWFRVDDSARDQVIAGQGDPTSSGAWELAVEPSAGSPVVRWRLRLDDQVIELRTASVPTGTWLHVAGTWDGSTARLSLNGAPVASIVASGALVTDAPTPVVIGGAPDGSRALDGAVGQTRLDDVAWSAAQVAFAADNLLDPAGTVTVAAGVSGSWFDQGDWAQRRPLAIESDLVAGPLTDYPLLVQVTDPDLAAGLQTDAADLVFTAADGVTRLDHQVESWNPATGALTAWVRVPTLDDQTDVVLYLYLVNPNAIDQQDPVGVWGPDADLVLLD